MHTGENSALELATWVLYTRVDDFLFHFMSNSPAFYCLSIYSAMRNSSERAYLSGGNSSLMFLSKLSSWKFLERKLSKSARTGFQISYATIWLNIRPLSNLLFWSVKSSSLPQHRPIWKRWSIVLLWLFFYGSESDLSNNMWRIESRKKFLALLSTTIQCFRPWSLFYSFIFIFLLLIWYLG
jgi:hypothetical protein